MGEIFLLTGLIHLWLIGHSSLLLQADFSWRCLQHLKKDVRLSIPNQAKNDIE